MNTYIKKIIKIICLLISLVLLIILCFMVLKFDKANQEEMSTPVQITPTVKKTKPVASPVETQKPLTRDQNNMPKSDYKVPEIG